jgi:hypothetical protein
MLLNSALWSLLLPMGIREAVSVSYPYVNFRIAFTNLRIRSVLGKFQRTSDFLDAGEEIQSRSSSFGVTNGQQLYNFILEDRAKQCKVVKFSATVSNRSSSPPENGRL